MAGIVVNGDFAGGVITAALQHWMTVGGIPAVVVGDPVSSNGDEPPAVMVQGSPWFSINGIPVCRMGDEDSNGDPAISTHPLFDIA